MSQISIRDAEDADCERLVELIVDLGHPIAIDQVRANLVALQGLGLDPLVAVMGGQIIGLCVPSVMHTLHREAPVGRISTMIVDKAHRGAGVGALLVEAAERRLAEHACGLIEVTSNHSRTRAHHFYERLCYRYTSKRFAKDLSPR